MPASFLRALCLVIPCAVFAGHNGDCPIPSTPALAEQPWPGVNLDFESPSVEMYAHVDPEAWFSAGDFCHTNRNTYISASGIGPWGNIPPASGNQYIALQLANAFIKQRITLPQEVRKSGFTISFSLSMRGSNDAGITLLLDDTQLFSGKHSGDFEKKTVTVNSTLANSLGTSFVITFKSFPTGEGDRTAFLDNVELSALPSSVDGAIIQLTGDSPTVNFGEPDAPICELYLNRAESRLESTCEISTPDHRRLDDGKYAYDPARELEALKAEITELRRTVNKLIMPTASIEVGDR